MTRCCGFTATPMPKSSRSMHLLPVKSITAFPIKECPLPSFENVADCLPYRRGFKRTAVVAYLWQGYGVRALRGHDDNLVSVGVYYQVGVMSYDDHLSSAPRFPEVGHQFFKHRFRVEVLLRLIDDQWASVMLVDHEIQE